MSRFVITGMPRSGTTLAAALAESRDDVLCLNEPSRYYEFVRQTDCPAAFVSAVMRDLNTAAAAVNTPDGIQDVRLPDGRYPTNYIGPNGKRIGLMPVSVRKRAGDQPLLVGVKHNEPLTAVLPDLRSREDLRAVVIVRQPVPTILSWRAAPIPLSIGLLSPGYRFWPEAHDIKRSSRTVLEFQARIYELYCARYLREKAHVTLLRYEDIVADASVVLKALGRGAITGVPPLSTANGKRTADHDRELRAIIEAVKAYCPTAREIYGDADYFHPASLHHAP